MPKYVFTDAQPKSYEPIEGEFIARVTDCEFTISQGKKTVGADQMELTFVVMNKGVECSVFESLIFHGSTIWKIDSFVKSFNLLIDGNPVAKGQSVEWSESMVIGLQGWIKTFIEEFKAKDGTMKRKTKIAAFLAKEKLPKIEAPTDESEEDAPF